jgi:hypothetical protein
MQRRIGDFEREAFGGTGERRHRRNNIGNAVAPIRAMNARLHEQMLMSVFLYFLG